MHRLALAPLSSCLLLIATSGAAHAGWLSGTPPTDLGVKEGRLKPCPPTPNCVSSQAETGAQRIEPFVVVGDPVAAMTRIHAIVTETPGARIVEERPGYLRAEYASEFFGFVDDVEFALSPDGRTIEVRSASRLGRSDFGVNRRRIEALRSRLAPQ